MQVIFLIFKNIFYNVLSYFATKILKFHIFVSSFIFRLFIKKNWFSNYRKIWLAHYSPAMPFGKRKIYFRVSF